MEGGMPLGFYTPAGRSACGGRFTRDTTSLRTGVSRHKSILCDPDQETGKEPGEQRRPARQGASGRTPVTMIPGTFYRILRGEERVKHDV